jgi:hypothetical protein
MTMPAIKLDETLLESRIQASIVSFARSKLWNPVKLVSVSRKGWPDLCVLGHGWTVWLEVKKPGGIVSPSQKALMNRMKDTGLNVHVVRSVSEAKLILMARARTRRG